MKLLTKEIRDRLRTIYKSDRADPIVQVKFFTPDSSWTWYVTEGQDREDGDFEFYGYVEGFEGEWGYFVLSELERARGPLGLKIERDLHFPPKPFSQIKTRASV
jgi:hypothetical protein